MERSTEMGKNRTGVDMSPFASKAMVEDSDLLTTPGSDADMKALKRGYADDAEPVGSVPVPGSAKGMAKAGLKKMTGKNPEMFINKLGERLAYERSGVRIYESFIEKCRAAMDKGTEGAKIPVDRLEAFRDQEAEHFVLVKHCLEKMGADPTAQTPDADVTGMASLGLIKVITDPRTSISQSLEAMLSIELTDNAAWELLIKLAEDMGMSDMAREFEQALKQEDVHLQDIREWYEQMVRGEARMSL